MARKKARLYVLAGVNGAGKSSIGGAAIRAAGGNYFNPDEAARELMAANPGLGETDANAAAWQQGRRLLERAIDQRLDFTFETTLGGTTMPRLIAEAGLAGHRGLRLLRRAGQRRHAHRAGSAASPCGRA